MSYLNALLTDLRDRKLWPVPLVLLAALVAVPVLLSKSPSPQHPAPIPGLAIAAAQPGASVTVDATPVQASLTAGSRDPFSQQKLPGATSSSTGSTAAAASSGTGSSSTVSSSTGSVSSSGSSSSGGSSSGGNGTYTGGGSGTRTGTGTTGGATTPTHPAAPAGLTRDQSYDVMLATPLGNGGFTTATAQRGTELPSPQQPQLVELGVAQGARDVLFAVMPGTVVSGAGTCVPGPLDCEILSLAPNQTEAIAVQTATTPHSVGSFTLTSIDVHTWSSAAQATAKRALVDRAGERLLANTPEHAFSLFSYNPSLGVVVDERNLQVGGN